MVQNLGIGVLAGLVSALLFGMLLKASPLSLLLYLLSPLPILIVGLGWSYRAALGAVVAGGLALALGVTPYMGLGFAVYLALPAWWLAYLVLLGRPAEGGDGREGGSIEWYPLGRLLAWVAGTAALAFVAIAVIAAPNYETFRTQLTAMSRKVVQTQLQGRLPPSRRPTQTATPPTTSPQAEAPPGETPPPARESDRAADGAPERTPGSSPEAAHDLQSEVAEALVRLAPALAAQGLAVLFVTYLWIAARVVQISGRLMRPWPDIPATAMPRAVLPILAAAAALALAPGYLGVLGTALLGAFAAAFAMQGLAAFHDRSRGRPMRGALLIGLYVVLFLTQGVALVALSLFGIADTALSRRRPAGSPPPGGPA